MPSISLSTSVTYWLSLCTPTTLTLLSFTLLGLLNNILYVLLLSAAQDLVGPTTPKSLVLLADVLPSFLTKLLAPYFIHHISYPVRIFCLILLSSGGMLIVSLTPTDASPAKKMSGVILASLSSGAGELSFLGLTSFYGPGALAGWGSGTGIAGLAGAGLYVVMTDWWGLTVRRTLLVSATFPLGMAFAFWLLPPPLVAKAAEYRAVDTEEEEAVNEDVEEVDTGDVAIADSDDSERDIEGFSDEARGLVAGVDAYKNAPATFARRIAMIRRLFFPYMLPLFLVYVAEYTINQGVAPVLLFPLESSPFSSFREFYPMYGFLYQLGVFISRSSTPFVRLRRLYPPSLLQCVNLALLLVQAMFFVLPSVYVVFLIIFWEGLLGGAVYVNTFAAIMEEVAKEQHEFSLGATSVSDSAGICVAGFVGMGLEMALCGWQVGRGRDWCRNMKVSEA